MARKQIWSGAIPVIGVAACALLLVLLIVSRPAGLGGESYRCADCSVILISIDTLRADHLGCYGYHRDTSPNIDALSKEAILFEEAYAQSHITDVSHATILTSLHPGVHRTTPMTRLDERFVTLPEYMQEGGYATAGFLECPYMMDEKSGFAQGFQHFNSEFISAEQNNQLIFRWLDRHAREKIFLFVHYYDVHSDEGALPYQTETDYDHRFFQDCSPDFWDYPRNLGGTEILKKIAFEDLAIEKQDLDCVVSLYDGGIAYTDGAVGHLLDKLRELGIYRDALIILTADHGEGFMEHGRVLHSQPYREVTRVPLIMKFPGSRRHARVGDMIGLIDLMPTILDIARIEHRDLQGASLLPVIRGEERKGRSVFSYKRKRSEEGERFDYLFLRNRDFSFYSRMFGEFELYDRSVDIGEAENIAAGNQELEKGLIVETVDFYREQESTRERLIGEEKSAEVLRTEEEWERLRSLGYVE